ncbi:MAG TPA: hypothetical protein VKT78_02465 [Fimbriimonadaceae bacterium]|nr:hypothetical protein [Fimbriimonadaceae bacterium]
MLAVALLLLVSPAARQYEIAFIKGEQVYRVRCGPSGQATSNPRRTARVDQVVRAPDGRAKIVVLASQQGQIWTSDLYLVEGPPGRKRWLGHGSSAQWSPRGDVLAVAFDQEHGTVPVLLNYPSLRPRFEGQCVVNTGWDPFSPNGRMISYFCGPNDARSTTLVDVRRGRELVEPELHEFDCRYIVAWSRDSRRYVESYSSRGKNDKWRGTLAVVDLERRRVVRIRNSWGAERVRFSRDGSRLIWFRNGRRESRVVGF